MYLPKKVGEIYSELFPHNGSGFDGSIIWKVSTVWCGTISLFKTSKGLTTLNIFIGFRELKAILKENHNDFPVEITYTCH